MRKTGLIPVAVALAALSCGGPPSPAGDKPKAAPPLVLENLADGTPFSLAEQKGKVVLVDLWATWCAPCLMELPHLQKLSEAYDPREFALVGIVLESGEAAEIRDFIRERGISYANLLGQEGTKEAFGPFLGYPTKYLIDRKGFIVKKYFGMVGEQLAEDVERLVRTGSLAG